MNPPSLCGSRRKPNESEIRTGHTVQQFAAPRKRFWFLPLDCIHLYLGLRVENRDTSLDSMEDYALRSYMNSKSGEFAGVASFAGGAAGRDGRGGKDQDDKEKIQ
jgi:hypothetical protein